MDACKTCQEFCCNKTDILIFRDEYERLKRFSTEIPVKDWGLVLYMEPPCRFLNGHNCSVHEFRPLSCRKYPLFFKIEGDLVNIGFLPFCPPFKPTQEFIEETQNNPAILLQYVGLTETEFQEMFVAAIEQESRIILAKEFLDPSTRKMIDEYLQIYHLPRGEPKQGVVVYSQIIKEKYHMLISVGIQDILKDPANHPFGEMLYKEYPEKWHKVKAEWEC